MTTLKEYKAMMEGATDAPWSYLDEWSGIYDAPDIRGAQVRIAEIVRTSDYKSNAQFIAASRNIAPDLIQVIELAEVELKKTRDWINHIKPSRVDGGYEIPNSVKIGMEQTIKAHDMVLSEIRKLKGE